MLKITDLKFSINSTHILNGVNLEVTDGEMVGLIGPNGSGKTTLFNCISGFNTPTAGEIYFKESDVTHIRPYRRAQLGLGRVFQNFAIFKEMTVAENIVIALESRQPLSKTFWPWGSSTRSNFIRAKELLAEVGLAEKAKDKAASLSGGQMRLLEIMRTLAYGADFFLLDEPTAGVSPKMKSDVANLINKLKSAGKTVLAIEHDINFIQSICDRIIVLNLGQVVLDGTPDEVRNSPILQEVYFGNGKDAKVA